jgi:hypothetical protein
MQRLSATDAIAPAWNHTNQLLVAPRNWRLLLKIGFIACLAQGGGGSSFNVPSNSFGQNSGKLPTIPSPVFSPGLITALIVGGVVLFVLGLVLFYVSARLQFVFFEVILRGDTRLGPIWRRYGALTWRWIGLKLLLLLVTLVLLLPILVPFGIEMAHRVTRHDTQNIGAILLSLFGTLALLFVALLLLGCVAILLQDFGLPIMALEMTSVGDTIQRVFRLMKAEPGQMLLYLFFRILLAVAAGIAIGVCFVLIALVALIPFGLVGGGLWLVLHSSGSVGYALMVTVLVLLGLAFVVLFVCLSFMANGLLLAFLEAYALYFLGGRVPRVGAYLEPGPPPPYAPPPVFPAPDEDDDGPALPMNPALV